MPVISGGDLYVVGSGPLDASTSRQVVVRRPVVFDTNRYYADLGIRPDATRREIREAYQRLDGQSSPRLTYIVKQLLDPEIRARYDETPLGSFFYDYEIESWIRAARVRESSRLRAEGRVEEAQELEDTDYTDVLDTDQGEEHASPASPFHPVWDWAYVLHQTNIRDVERLRLWQQYLISAIGVWGGHLRIGVGFSGGMASRWGVVENGPIRIVLLDEMEEPSEALANEVASRVVNHLAPARSRGHHTERDKEMTGNFRRGADAAKEAQKSGGSFARTQFFNIEDGKTAILRFLTDADQWIVVDQHQVVPTKAKPADYPKDARWPERMGAVCRKDPAFNAECYVCDNIVDGKKVKKPGARSWALACLREEVVEGGKVVGLRDMTREVTIPAKDGEAEKKVTEKAIVVVNMGYKNFFGILEGFAGRYGTVLDRDYWIKRSGEGTDTTYQIVPMDPIETESGRFDLREAEFAKRYETDLNLEEIITERASEEFYARFFDPRYTVEDGKIVPASGGGGPKAPSGDEEAPSSSGGGDVDPERMSALANRVKGYAGAGASSGGESSGGGMKDFS